MLTTSVQAGTFSGKLLLVIGIVQFNKLKIESSTVREITLVESTSDLDQREAQLSAHKDAIEQSHVILVQYIGEIGGQGKTL